MEKLPHEEYRDSRAKELKDLRNSGEREYAKRIHAEDEYWFHNKDGINNNLYKKYREQHLQDIRRKLGIHDEQSEHEDIYDIEKKIDEMELSPLTYGKSLGEQIDKDKLVDPKEIEWLLKALTDNGNEDPYIPDHWQEYIPDRLRHDNVLDREKEYGVFAIDLNNPKVLNGFKVSYHKNTGKMMLLGFLNAESDIRKLPYEAALSRAKLEFDSDVFEAVVGKDWSGYNFILMKKS